MHIVAGAPKLICWIFEAWVGTMGKYLAEKFGFSWKFLIRNQNWWAKLFEINIFCWINEFLIFMLRSSNLWVIKNDFLIFM